MSSSVRDSAPAHNHAEPEPPLSIRSLCSELDHLTAVAPDECYATACANRTERSVAAPIVVPMGTPVSDAEIDYERHDPYLEVIIGRTDSVGEALAQMAVTARAARRSMSEDDLPAVREALTAVEATARSFLGDLARARCPEYLKGADAQLHDALKLLIDAGGRGAAAVTAMNAARLESIAAEMDAAADDIAAAAARVTDWRSGGARL